VPVAPSLSLEAFASITARLHAGVALDRALADAGVDAASWERAQREWLLLMAHLAEHGAVALHRRFLDRLAAHVELERARERAASRALEGPTPHPPAPRESSVAKRAVAMAARRGAAAASPPAVPHAPVPAPPRVPPPQVTRALEAFDPSVLAETASETSGPVADALPFVRAGGRPPSKALPFVAGPGTPVRTETAEEVVDLGDVLPFQRRRPAEALPFRRVAEPPALPLDRYAELCAALESDPARAHETLARFGLDAGAKARLDAHYRGELERNPARRQIFERALAAHRGR
jgi:hypothetical protein